jgi:DNA-binding NarL/FixJ family response regulator
MEGLMEPKAPQATHPSRPRRARILIVDDHELARAGLKYVLERQADVEVIGEAASGEAALDLAVRARPDLVLMDVRMPGIDGLETTRRLKRRCPTASVIIMTLYENPEYLSEALKAGAAGYLIKDASHHEVLSTVRRVLRGESPFNPQVFGQLMRRIGSGSPNAAGGPVEPLTPRERQVLDLVVRGHTNREIAAALSITTGTAKSHVERIIRKLGVTDRTQAAVRAVGLGLVTLAD